MREMGTATLGMSVERTLRRNTKTTRITSPMEMLSATCTSLTEARMVRVASMSTFSSMVGGNEAWSWGRMARTRSTVSMMLASGWRKMGTMMAGTPLDRPRLRMFSTESVTWATSERRRALPFLYAHDERLVVRGLHELVRGGQGPAGGAGGNVPFRPVDVGRCDGQADVFQGQALGVEHGGIHIHAHGRQRAAPYEDLAHALDLGELLLEHRGGDVIHPLAGDQVRGEREHEDR